MKIKRYLKEAGTRDNPIQDLAELVGKGGKFEHKGVYQYLQKVFDVKKETEEPKVKDIVDSLVDWNYHTEMAILEALMKRRKKDIDILLAIATEQHKLGHMPSDLSALRSYISDTKYFRAFGKKFYGDVPIRKNTVAIAKKMSKKQSDEFLSVFKKFI